MGGKLGDADGGRISFVMRVGEAGRDLRYALRSLRRDRRFAVLAIFTLTLGIAAATVVFSAFYNVMIASVAAPDAGRLVVLVLRDADAAVESTIECAVEDLQAIRGLSDVFASVGGYTGGIAQLRDGARTFQFDEGRVTGEAFDLYGVPALIGRGLQAEDARAGAAPVFVMSYKTWRNEFSGETGILGKSFLLEGESRVLVGVMPARFEAFGRARQIWVPIAGTSGSDLASGVGGSDREARVLLLARLKRGVSADAASAQLDLVEKRLSAVHPDEYPKHFSARVISITDYRMGPERLGGVFNSGIQTKSILYDLVAAVFILLLIACANVANLLLARATVREKEIAMRSALGASRGRIAQQLLMESLVLGAAACVSGCWLAWMGMKAVDAVIHQKAWGNIGAETVVELNWPVLFFAVSLALVTTVICGLAPAWHSMRRDLQPRLAGSSKGGSNSLRHGKLRAALVVGQVTLSIVLLIGAGLMIRSLYLLTHIDLGFEAKNILVAGFAPSRGGGLPDRNKASSPTGQVVFQKAIARIRELPGIESVAVNNTIPGYGPSRGPQVTVPGGSVVEEVGLDECDENCPDTLGMKLFRGRWFSREEVQTDQFVAVINRRLAGDLFGSGDPVGKELRVKGFGKWKSTLQKAFAMKGGNAPQDTNLRIVGVVNDVKNAGPQQPATPMAFVPPLITGAFILQVRTRVAPAAMMHEVQEQVWAVDRDEVFWVFDPLEDFLQEHTYSVPEFGATISGPVAGLALLLVTMGVSSVMAYSVSLRTQEIGVRMALGAQRIDILGMVVRSGAALIVVGVVLGMVAGWGLMRFLGSQIWGVGVTDSLTFALAAGLVLVVGVLACVLPARRAAGLDPLVALRYE